MSITPEHHAHGAGWEPIEPADDFERCCYEHVKTTLRGYLRPDERDKRDELTRLYFEREGAAYTGDIIRDALGNEPLHTLLMQALLDCERTALAHHLRNIARNHAAEHIDRELQRWAGILEVQREAGAGAGLRS